MIRAVLFDVDDTLCDDTAHLRRAIHSVAERVALGGRAVAAEAVAETYERLSTHFWTYEISLSEPAPIALIRERLWRETLEELEIAVDAGLLREITDWYARIRSELPDLHDGAHTTLHLLRQRGIKLGIVTNGLSETHIPKVSGLGLREYFDIFLMPDVTGHAKPDPRQFALACAQLGVAPQETVHVGDSLTSDVAGALAAGLHAVWFCPAGLPCPDSHAQIRALTELPALLETLAPPSR